MEINSVKNFVIIVAGGAGERMGSAVPKQFMELNGTPILMRSIGAFCRYNPALEIIVALPQNQIDFWHQLCLKHTFNLKHQVVAGGETRYHSVKNALKKIGEEGVVAIHDAVRPLVSRDTIQRVFRAAEEKGNAVPFIDLVDSLRYVTPGKNSPVDRTQYKLIQTPQAFDCQRIKKAYEQPFDPLFTDDASVAEKAGYKIHLVEGNRENIKITTPVDLEIARTLAGYLSE
ncbi:MAG: 2-C-methyl-D-erythritol 4-phosphate cytidylyltransferase [Bacteroidales bacterium]|jgi:2-C-methyl-D-erythritol 4-phosphate cytidylyltransferase|nr:2-C-methyl-D-erythritol 4-phosphate cytidylyltransferase [Bacteroidales bacterium]